MKKRDLQALISLLYMRVKHLATQRTDANGKERDMIELRINLHEDLITVLEAFEDRAIL